MEPSREGPPHGHSRAGEEPFWLQDERLDVDERLQRLLGDADVLGDIRKDGFAGVRYEEFATELARYGIAVISAWISRGQIFARCAHKGLRLSRPPRGEAISSDDALELALETVAIALKHFRDDVLVPGVWDPARGASLRTFFIGQCLLRFPNVYRRWQLEVTKRSMVIEDRIDLTDLQETHNVAHDVERDVISALAASEQLRHIKNPLTRRAIVMTSQGWSQAEIADELGMTTKAVERMLANERTRARRRKETG